MVQVKGTQLCCVRVRFSFRVDLRVRDRVCRVCEVKIYLVRGERRHRRSDERSDIAGGAIEIYREGKSEREEITASNKHRRDVFVSGDLQTSVFFMTTYVKMRTYYFMMFTYPFMMLTFDFVMLTLIFG